MSNADFEAGIAFIALVRDEVERSRDKYPSPEALAVGLMAEVGELAEALICKDHKSVWTEAAQVAAMALRIAVEGDPTLDEVRKRTVGHPKPKKEGADCLGCGKEVHGTFFCSDKCANGGEEG